MRLKLKKAQPHNNGLASLGPVWVWLEGDHPEPKACGMVGKVFQSQDPNLTIPGVLSACLSVHVGAVTRGSRGRGWSRDVEEQEPPN